MVLCSIRRPKSGEKVKSVSRWIALLALVQLLQLLFEGDARVLIVYSWRKPDVVEGERLLTEPRRVGCGFEQVRADLQEGHADHARPRRLAAEVGRNPVISTHMSGASDQHGAILLPRREAVGHLRVAGSLHDNH